MSPTQRTLAYLRAQHPEGYVQVVEKWIPQARKRVDLFDAIDIVLITGEAIVGVQCTSGSNHSKHKDKILASPRMAMWRKSGGLILLVSWSKRGDRGKRKQWQPRLEPIEFKAVELF